LLLELGLRVMDASPVAHDAGTPMHALSAQRIKRKTDHSMAIFARYRSLNDKAAACPT